MIRTRRFLYIILPGLLLCSSLFAGGQQEDRLKTARFLIEKQQYNEALSLLADIYKREPEKQEKTLQLMDEIRIIRDKFTEKSEELLGALDANAGEAVILKLFNELERIDPNPNETGQELLRLLRKKASRVGNYNYFQQIMDEALVFIQTADFLKAVEKYLSVFAYNPSFDLHQSEYATARLGNIIKTTVDREITVIREKTANFQEITVQLEKERTQLMKILAEADFSSQELASLTDTIISRFLTILDLVTNIETSAKVLAAQITELTKQNDNDELLDAVNYISYCYQLVVGRSAKTGTEGIRQAITLLVTGFNNTLITAIRQKGDEVFDQGKTFFDAGDYAEARTAMVKAYTLYAQVLQYTYFLDKQAKLGIEYPIADKGWDYAEDLKNFISAMVNVRSTTTYQTLIRQLEEMPFFTAITTSPDFTQLENIKINMARVLNNLKSIAEDWETYLTYGSPGRELNTDKANTIIRLSGNLISGFLDQYLRIMRLIHADFNAALTRESQLYKDGLTTDTLNAKGQPSIIIKYFPAERLIAFNRMQERLGLFRNYLEEIYGIWLYNDSLIASSSDLQQLIQAIAAFLHEIDVTAGLLSEYILLAEADLRDARKFKEEGFLRYDQADEALSRNDYTLAKRRLEDASDAFDNSLAKNEDPEVRQMRDYTLLKLDEKIRQAENQIVVTQVRKLLDKVIEQYSRGLYEEAETTLIRAQARWSEVKGDEKQNEIELWFGYVRTAKSIKTAREIPETDPLFKEMSQYQDYARRNYEDGIIRKQAGRQEQAAELFQAARNMILLILQSFPYNNDARVLDLRIRKEIDPVDFKREFDLKFKEAKQLLASNNKADQQRAYITLKDLLEIDPANTTLKREITEAEYILLLRFRPPDPKLIAESDRKTLEARKIIDNRQIDLFNSALSLLDDAIKLNPNNSLAKQLKDEVYLIEGGTQTSVISQAAKELYEKALELYLSGNFYAAKQIVDEALQDPVNRGYRKLTDLSKKIEVKL